MLDPYLLIASVCITAAITLYIFFWNRFLGFCLSLAFRIANWSNGPSSSWLEIGAVHFSLLAGRVLLRDVRYHSSNQTFKAVKAEVYWKYWIRRPASQEELSSNFAEDGSESARKLRCRVHMSFHGVEWFIYGRTTAFDDILSRFMDEMRPQVSTPVSRTTSAIPPSGKSSYRLPYPLSILLSSRVWPTTCPRFLRMPSIFLRAAKAIKDEMPHLDPLDLLPLGLDITKGAIIIGNPSTPSLLVAEFAKSSGTYGITESRSRFDLYKQLLDMKFDSVIIQMENNVDYEEPMVQTGESVQKNISSSKYSMVRRMSFSVFSKLWRSFHLRALPSFPYRGTSASNQRNTRKKGHANASDFQNGTEYAIERKLLETSTLELSYYADVPGDVPPESQFETPAHNEPSMDPLDIGNGGLAPEWGLDLRIYGGFVRYGPWSDRQRAELQRAFFPPSFSHVSPTPRVRSGDKRIWTSFNIFVEMHDAVTLLVPFREASKDWMWDGLTVEASNRPRAREAAAFHISMGSMSTIRYMMPMVATNQGYHSHLEVHLDEVAVTSTLNDICILKAPSCRIYAEMPAPLKWNDEREWTIPVSFQRPVIYILRDHINMITDLIKDWISGPPSDYHRFVPTTYRMAFDMRLFDMYLYINDHNIVDRPLAREDNGMIALKAPTFHTDVVIPSSKFRPDNSSIPFNVRVPDVSLSLLLPRWNTNSVIAQMNSQVIGKVGLLGFQGRYLYYSDVRRDNSDQLRLDIRADDVSYKALGWSVRHFMVLRDNYLGSFTTFSTLKEYLNKRQNKQPIGDPIDLKFRADKSNMLQVEIGVCVHKFHVLLPASLAGYETLDPSPTGDNPSLGASTILVIPELQLHLRLHDYFMEMSLNVGSISGSIEDNLLECEFFRGRIPNIRETFALDNLSVVANRLFGPLPRTSTYFCVWEIGLDSITARHTVSELQALMAVMTSFKLGFADVLNVPAAEFSPIIDPDATFLKVSLGTVHNVVLFDSSAISLSIPEGLTVDSNDWAGSIYRKVFSVRLPDICMQALVRDRDEWLEAARLQFDICMDRYVAPAGWPEDARAQRDFITKQDHPTGRLAHFLKSVIDGEHKKEDVFLPKLSISRWNEFLQSNHDRRKNSQISRSTTQGWYHHSDSSDSDVRPRRGNENPLIDIQSIPSHRRLDEVSEELSSGDESDDVSDVESTETEILDVSLGPSDPLVADYRSIVSVYHGAFIEPPSFWPGNPFVLKHNRLPPRLSHETAQILAQGLHRSIKGADQGMTTIRIHSRTGINLVFSPLLFLVAECAQETWSQAMISPQLILDGLIARHITDYRRQETSFQDNTIIDVSVLSVDATLVMAAPSLERLGARENFVPPRYMFVNGFFEGTHSRVVIMKDSYGSSLGEVTASFEAAKLTMHPMMSNTRRPVSPPPFSFSIASLVYRTIGSDNSLTITSTLLEADHSAPPNALILAISIQGLRHRIGELFSRRVKVPREAHVVFRTLELSENKHRVDPFSTIQPSFLIQTGLPNELRTDTIFRLLVHLRVCSLYFTDDQSASILSEENNSPVNLRERIAHRVENLTGDVDASDKQLTQFAEILLPRHERIDEPSPRDKFQTLFAATLHRAEIIIAHSPTSKDRSRLHLIGIRTIIHDHDTLLTVVHQSSPGQHHNGESVRKLGVSVNGNGLQLFVLPQLLHFVQTVVWSTKHFPTLRRTHPLAKSEQSNQAVLRTYCVLSLFMETIEISASAPSLTLSLSVTSLAETSFLSSSQDASHSLSSEKIIIQACSSKGDSQTPRELAVLVLSALKMALTTKGNKHDVETRLVYNLGNATLTVPRSVLRLYSFVEDWKEEFFPAIGTAFHEIFTEIRHSQPVKEDVAAIKPLPRLHLHGRVMSLQVILQIMHHTWLTWDAQESNCYLDSLPQGDRTSAQFGVCMASQKMGIFTDTEIAPERNTNPPLRLSMPSVILTGSHQDASTRILVSVDFFYATIKPSHWDTILMVQQKFGQDFNDLIALIEHRRQKTPDIPKPISHDNADLNLNIQLKMSGFCIGLRGLSSNLFLECENISGNVIFDPLLSSRLDLKNLALSLATSGPQTKPKNGPEKNVKSAFVVIDLHLDGHKNSSSSESGRISVLVNKIHAVMQPSSISEIGDFVDHIQGEMTVRQQERSAELQAFKEKTKSFIKTFESKSEGALRGNQKPWLDNYTLNLDIRRVGVAFPLVFSEDFFSTVADGAGAAPVRAFLFSVQSLTFSAQHGESGQAAIHNLSFQFISSFKQSVPAHFVGENHSTRIRLVYPHMNAQVRTQRSIRGRETRVVAEVSGFVLDIDSSMPDYIFSLIDVYRQGTERLNRPSSTGTVTATAISTTSSYIIASNLVANRTLKQTTFVQGSHILASMTFSSGKVRLYSSDAPVPQRSRIINAGASFINDDLADQAAELFKLPEVSVWAEYRKDAQERGRSSSVQPSMLLFKSTVHSSSNLLKPGILPFLAETMNHVERRMRKLSIRQPHHPSPEAVSQPSESQIRVNAINATSSMQISLGLRIDQSKLELTCHPDVNVVAGLHWDSGGFVVNISPGARKVSFTGNVAGLTVGLKHGFLSEDCLNLEARNLGFSATFAKLLTDDNSPASSASLVVDTELSGGVRFSRLQDVLCFKAVWLDKIPIFSLSASSEKPESIQPRVISGSGSDPTAVGPEFTTTLLIRVRQIHMEADLGHSISTVTLDLNNAVLRTKLSDRSYEVSVFVADVDCRAKGNISGRINVPRCVFQTIRRRDAFRVTEGSLMKVLELSLTSGPLEAVLESDHQRLLQYRAEPLEVQIYDDWSNIVQKSQDSDSLRLSFTIKGSEITAIATIGAIPKLMMYATKFSQNLDAQRDGAARESATFKSTRIPKPSNPLSAVANAMIISAKDRLKEANIDFSRAVQQHMSFKLETLRLIVFPRSMTDLEMAHFLGRNVSATLNRTVEAEGLLPKRDLTLSFLSMTISRYSHLQHSVPGSTTEIQEWVASLLKHPEANIVGLPSMAMHMKSEENTLGNTRQLIYDFDSHFRREETHSSTEDIYITLNMSLYAWLTVLRKTLTREMNQATVSRSRRLQPKDAERRQPPASVTVTGSSRSATLELSPPSTPAFHQTSNLTTQPVPFPTDEPRVPLSENERTISRMSSQDSRLIGLQYEARKRRIERLTMRQLGEATPDVMHPFFKRAGFDLEESLPQYVHEYATKPLEEILDVLLQLYSKQLHRTELLNAANMSAES